MTAEPRDAVFRTHLDLSPLRQRRRGVVRCIFHRDAQASLSVDLDRGLFNCFGCGAHGGTRRFAELVGDAVAVPARAPESPLQAARRWAATRARREAEQAQEWEPWMIAAEFIRRTRRAVDGLRQIATELGPDHPRTWPALEVAAQAERQADAVEAEIDDLLASGRIG